MAEEDPRLQGASPFPCVADGDCPASLVCYGPDVTWTNNQSYCLCSTWYGWTLSSNPPLCDLAVYAQLSIAFFALLAVFYLYRLAVLVLDMQHLLRDSVWKRRLSLTWTSILTMGWIMANFSRMILLCLEFGQPEVQTLMPYGPNWKYSPYGVYHTKPALSASSIFGILVDFSLIVVWFSVASRSLRLSKKNHKYELPLKLIVASLEISYVIGAMVLVMGEYVSDYLYFTIPYLLIAVIGYIIAGYLLTSIMETFGQQTNQHGVDQMAIVAKRIKLTAFLNGCLILLSIVYSFLFGYYNYIFKEVGFFPAGAHNAGVAITAAQIYVISRFLHLTIQPRYNGSKDGGSKVGSDAGVQPTTQPMSGKPFSVTSPQSQSETMSSKTSPKSTIRQLDSSQTLQVVAAHASDKA